MHIEEYVQLVGEEIVDEESNVAKLVDLAWGREIHLGFSLSVQKIEITFKECLKS